MQARVKVTKVRWAYNGGFFSKLYFIMITILYASGSSASLSCKDVLNYRNHTELIRPPNVYRVDTAQGSYVYKIYVGPERGRLNQEYQALLLLNDLVNRAQVSFLKATEGPRLTEDNEFFLKDYMFSGLGLRAEVQPPMQMLVTRFEPGREMTHILEDESITVAQKEELIEKLWGDVEQLIAWVNAHPDYRFLGEPIIITEKFTGDWFEYPSQDGVYEFEYRYVDFKAGNIMLLVDGFSNIILNPHNQMVLFDPY